ncbi:prepilin peptidase [Sphingomonas sp. MMS12-HWE2-04]|uniref:prepilin peptidase n=1 Tax=Sphingomonas sp. MMS12-HWE2-04 TaxID=3234199 RepID=UPI00384B475A
MSEATWFWPALLGLLGAALGSFIATLAIRWPEGRSVARGRSHCDGCGKALGAGELVPVLSYIVQRGRCRSCGAAIRPSHVLTELAAIAIGVAAGLAAPGIEGVAGAVFGWLLLALAALDLAAFWLPNILTGALALAGLAVGLSGWVPPSPEGIGFDAFSGLKPDLVERLIGGAAGFASLWLVAMLYRRVRGRHGLGGGDPKMFGGIGLWLGWKALPIVLLAACLVGLVSVLGMALLRHRVHGTVRLPFGAMLAIGAFGIWLAMTLAPPPLTYGSVIELKIEQSGR